MSKNHIRNQAAIRDALWRGCEQGEVIMLLFRNTRLESVFLRLDQDCFHVAAAMRREEVMSDLRAAEMIVRFPCGSTFMEGGVSLLGLGMIQGRPSLRLSIPQTLQDKDYRGAFRVERVGRIPVTFSTRVYELLVGNLVNISTTGARIHARKNFELDEVLVEDQIAITIPLEPDIYINTKAIVRYVQGRSVGLEFRPSLQGSLLDSLTQWTNLRRREYLQRARRREAQAEG